MYDQHQCSSNDLGMKRSMDFFFFFIYEVQGKHMFLSFPLASGDALGPKHINQDNFLFPWNFCKSEKQWNWEINKLCCSLLMSKADRYIEF